MINKKILSSAKKNAVKSTRGIADNLIEHFKNIKDHLLDSIDDEHLLSIGLYLNHINEYLGNDEHINKMVNEKFLEIKMKEQN